MSNLTRRKGEAIFEGKKKPLIKCTLPREDFETGVLLIGELEELECETPLEEKVDIFGLVKSKKKPQVVATGNGKLVLVISSDKICEDVTVNPTDAEVKKAIELHTAFHGTNFDSVKKINIDEPDYLVFFGHLNFIVYDVPSYSERRGVPFIHEARDRGDDVSPSKDKPIICVSPKRDYLVMYGTQFEFTERGIIG